MANYLNEEIRQIKLYPPGCQTSIQDTISVNDLFFCYSSTMTVVVFSIKSNRLKAMINLDQDKYVKSVALNKGKKYELALFYDFNIILYSLQTLSTLFTFKCDRVTYLEFNSDNKLMALNSLNELYLIDIITKKMDCLKVSGKVTRVQWHPFTNGDYVYSNTDNEISYQNINEKNRRCYVDLGNSDKEIVHLAWYNCDENFKYVLVGFKSCEIFLVDLSIRNPCVIIQFDKSGRSLVNVIWMKTEPGNFFTVTKGSGRITIWNVSKKRYKEITKFCDYSIVNCVPFSDGKRMLMSLENGMVQIYDIVYKKVQFLISPGHSETVFDLKISPFVSGIFASCAYDGNIKVWNMTTNSVNVTLKVNEPGMSSIVKIYSLKWSPLDKDLLLSGDSENSIRVWDINKQKQISSLVLGKDKGEVIGMDWSLTEQIIATCNESVYIISYEINKLILKHTISAKTKLFQCKFNPKNQKQFALACFNGSINFYSTNTQSSEIDFKYSGHTQKVFGLAYNFSLNYLASSSDDLRIGIWDIYTGKPNFLVGHTNNVRQIVWITETPKLLISGSWDGTARIWNIDYMICIGLINDHHSDVYGIDISPHHPFLIITSSRDNSIRFWNYLKNPIEYIIYFSSNKNPELYHSISRLEKEMLSLKDDAISKAEALCNFFFYLDGIKELFDILRVVMNVKEHNSENNRIFYIGDLYSAYKSKVLGLEFNYYNQKKFDYSTKKKDFLKEAIALSAKCGDWEKYCELSIVLGLWKEAIMAAPNVSIAYWQELTQKYAEHLFEDKEATEEERINASLNLTNTLKAIELIANGDKSEDAKIVWLSRTIQDIEKKHSGDFIKAFESKSIETNKGFFSDEDFGEQMGSRLDSLTYDNQLSTITYQIAKEKINKCLPIEAACAFLSIKNITLCIKTLVRTNELEVAYFIMKLTSNNVYESDILLGLISKQIKGNNINLAYSIADMASHVDLKIILYLRIMTQVKIDEEHEKVFQSLITYCANSNLQLVLTKNYNSLYNAFNELTSKLNQSLSNDTIDKKNIKDISLFFNIIQAFNWKHIEEAISKQFYLRILSTCAVLEMLNRNSNSALTFLFIINDSLQNNQLTLTNQIDKNFIGLAYSYYLRSNNFYIGNPSSTLTMINSYTNENYEAIQTAFDKISSYDFNKYSCDQMTQFYYLRESKFPIKAKEMINNTITRKPIKGEVIQVSSTQYNISLSQVMEISKYIPKMFD